MANAYQKAELARQEAVKSNARILMKTAKDFVKEGDYIKAVLVAEEAIKPINKETKDYEALNAVKQSILNAAVYHNGATTLTEISTNNKLTYMSVSADEKYVAYGLENNDTAIARIENGEVLKRFSGHSQQVKFVDFSKDGKYLASSSFDSTCIIYDLEKGEEKLKLEIEGIPMLTKFSEDDSKLFYAANINNNTHIYVYDTKTWQKEGEVVTNERIKYADIKKDGSEVLTVLSSDTEEQLTRRSLKDGSIIEVIPRLKAYGMDGKEYDKPYKAANYSNDGKSLILLTDEEMIKVSLEDKKEIFKKDIHTKSDDSKVILESDNGEKIAVKANLIIYLVDGNSGEITDEIYFTGLNMKYFTYNYDTNTVVGFGENGKYSIWKDKLIVEDSLSYGGVPIEFIFLKDGSRIVANSHESQTIKIIDLKSRVLSEPIHARIMGESDNFSYMLLFDGNDFLVSADNGKTSKKIIPEGATTFGDMSRSKYNKISNDGKYYAYLSKEGGDTAKLKPALKLYSIKDDVNNKVLINTTASSFTFTDDSKQILLLDNIDGLKIYDTKDLKQVKSYSNIKNELGDIKLSKDSKILVINRFAGIASIYDLESGEHIDDVPGEVVSVQNEGGEIKLKGIQNNTAFSWSSKEGLNTWEMDEECSQTAISFDDVKLYNENADILMMIRNNEADRKCYVVDFSTGRLMMTLNTSVKDYNVNGYISPDGKLIAIDQNYIVQYNKESSSSTYYITSTVYKVLSEEEVSKEVEEIVSGRTLSQEEKVQIGISAE